MKTILFMSWLYLVTINCFATSCESSEPVTKFIFGKTLDTIGDSIVSNDEFRCRLRDKGLKFDFTGGKVDFYGFMHDGYAGYNTLAILNKTNSIPFADAYFLLAGTNDINSEPIITVRNIIWIAGALRPKNQYAPIFISTLLPTTNAHNSRNQEVNKILLSFGKILCYNCVVIDAGGEFYRLPNWKDFIDDGGVHLTVEGYEAYTSIVRESLRKLGF